jgi:hypothetical protein
MLKMLLAANKALASTLKSDPLYKERLALRNRIASTLMFG